jgi:hypothetical protein
MKRPAEVVVITGAFGSVGRINNAMASVFAPVTDVTADEFRHVMEVTFEHRERPA